MSAPVPAGAAARWRAGAVALAAVVALVDQASKYWVLNLTDLPLGERMPVVPSIDLVLTWNYGISYGLFQQDEAVGRWALVAFTVVASLALGTWMLRTGSRLAAFSLALIVGGAVGNLIDRVLFGAVVDFVYFHVLDFSWYVFNLADSAIVAGVAGLMYDSLRSSHKDAANSG